MPDGSRCLASPYNPARRGGRETLPAGRGIHRRVMPMFRISRDGQEPVVDVETAKQIEPTVQSGTPGRFLVEEIRANDDPFPSGHQTRPWGTAIHHPDGQVALRQFLYCDDVAPPLDRIRVPRSLRCNFQHRTSLPWTHRFTCTI
jgi:hypothetical protein